MAPLVFAGEVRNLANDLAEASQSVEAAAAEFASPDFGEELARVTAVTRRVCTR